MAGAEHVREAQQGLGPAPEGLSPRLELPPALLGSPGQSVEYFTRKGRPSARDEKPHGLCHLGVYGLSEDRQANEKCCQGARSLPWYQLVPGALSAQASLHVLYRLTEKVDYGH